MSMQSIPLSPMSTKGFVLENVNSAGVTIGLQNEAAVDLHVVRNLANTAVPVILPASGTVTTAGALSFTSVNLPASFTGGAWVYFPAATASQTVAGATVAFGTAVAGFYWVVFSSNTAGTVYQNFIAAANMGVPTVPATLGIVATGSNSAYVATATILQMASVTIPANQLLLNGSVRADSLISWSGDTNSKVVTAGFGTAAKAFTNATAATLESELVEVITNRGVANVQVRRGDFNYVMTTANAYAAQDTTAAVVYKISGTSANVASNIILEAFSLDVLPN